MPHSVHTAAPINNPVPMVQVAGANHGSAVGRPALPAGLLISHYPGCADCFAGVPNPLPPLPSSSECIYIRRADGRGSRGANLIAREDRFKMFPPIPSHFFFFFFVRLFFSPRFGLKKKKKMKCERSNKAAAPSAGAGFNQQCHPSNQPPCTLFPSQLMFANYSANIAPMA